MLAQGGAKASRASICATLGNRHTGAQSPEGAALTDVSTLSFVRLSILGPPRRGLFVKYLPIPGLRKRSWNSRLLHPGLT